MTVDLARFNLSNSFQTVNFAHKNVLFCNYITNIFTSVSFHIFKYLTHTHLTMHAETLIFLFMHSLLQILVHNDFTSIPDYARSSCHKSCHCSLLLTLLFRRDTIAMLGPLLTFPITTPCFLSKEKYFN